MNEGQSTKNKNDVCKRRYKLVYSKLYMPLGLEERGLFKHSHSCHRPHPGMWTPRWKQGLAGLQARL